MLSTAAATLRVDLELSTMSIGVHTTAHCHSSTIAPVCGFWPIRCVYQAH
jgi:hypothetical protein